MKYKFLGKLLWKHFICPNCGSCDWQQTYSYHVTDKTDPRWKGERIYETHMYCKDCKTTIKMANFGPS